tara:strand:+ start:115 stop:579 length:465 start_codon:yes stop_codon:yes gene_type:complete
MITDYYELLHIEKTSDLNDINKAFRREIALYHPDNNQSLEAKEKFTLVVEAFEVLSDIEKRRKYDELLKSKTTNKLLIIEQQEQYGDWQKEAKTKSETYRESSLSELFLMDIFGEAGINGLFAGSEALIEGVEPLVEGLTDTLGDIVGGLFDGL